MRERARRIVRKWRRKRINNGQFVAKPREMLLTYFFRWYYRAVTSPEYLAAMLATCPEKFRSSISTSIP